MAEKGVYANAGEDASKMLKARRRTNN